MKRAAIKLAWAIGVSATGLLATSVAAQSEGGTNANVGEAAEEQDNGNVIIVTAGRREQNIIDVEASLSVFDQTFIEDRNIDTISDLVALTPGLDAARNDILGENTRFSVRGVSSVTSFATATTGVYLDDVPLTLGAVVSVPNVRTFDLQRVEVLKGPQGTLFGAGAMGGAIRYISNKPNTQEFEGQVRLEGSTTERGGENYSIDAAVNIPIVEDKLALRVVGSYVDEDGYIDLLNFVDGPLEDSNTREVESIRGTLRWRPADNLTIDFQAWYEENNLSGLNTVQADAVFAPGVPPVITLPASPFADEVVEGLADINTQFQQYSATITLELDWAEIVSTTSYYDNVFDGEFDLGFGGRLIDREGSGFAQEVRISTRFDGPVNLVGGVFFQDAELDDTFAIPGFGLLAPSTEEREQLSFFGEVYVEPVPDIEVTAGLRYFTERVEQSTVTNFGNFQPSPPVTRTDNNTRTVPKFAISYTGIEGVNFYVTASQGFRVGGNNLSAFPNVPPTFDGDDIWAFEAGVKFALFDGALNGALAGFYTDWTNVQVSIGGFGAPTIVNAGGASIRGVELQVFYEIVDGLSLGLTGTLLDAQIDEDTAPINPAILPLSAGDRLPGVTEESLALFANYETSINDTWDFFATADLAFNGDQVSPFQDVITESTTRANARLGAKSERFEIAAFVRNLTNDDTLSFFSDFAFSVPRPRTIGIELISRF